MRRTCKTPNGTNVMAPCPEARGFSTGETRENFRRGSYKSADTNPSDARGVAPS